MSIPGGGMFNGGLPGGPSMPDGDIKTEQWQEYVGHLQQFLQASTGVQRKQIESQIDNAKKGLANQMAIARLQAETSRYGIDAQRETAMKQLEENQRQFDATHALDMQKFGLDVRGFGLNYAKAETDYLSTPDRYAQGADFRAAAARILGQGMDPNASASASGPTPYGAATDFQAKTPQDFAVLANRYGTMEGVPNGGSGNAEADRILQATGSGGTATGGTSPYTAPTPYGASAAAAGTGATTQAQPAGGGEQKDPRVGVLTSMFKAMPPSSDEGMDANDFAVLDAAKALMSTNLKPGSLERMRPDQRAIYSSYVKRSGRSWNDYLTDYKRSGVGQQSARLA